MSNEGEDSKKIPEKECVEDGTTPTASGADEEMPVEEVEGSHFCGA